ncbi:hypothetical protein [Brevundimonas sp. M20]|uniref:hypothetical protein n=1 Tax=Brevundimonas sp. M20 TaxID=2591463 RepID=UPI0011461D60|nr:hypothetical protein [Brevundimonas sp. M20]QDH72402.1 hypothetical protein FKQ52_02535 [Brevundimonas sp. M20]
MARGRTRTLIEVQSGILELLIVAALLSIGVEVATAPVLGEWNLASAITLACGSILILLAISLVVRRHFLSLNRSFEAKGVIICDQESHDIIRVHRYEFGQASYDSIVGLFSENPAQKKLWVESLEKGHLVTTRGEFNAIIEESIEYFALKNLSHELGRELGGNEDDPLITKLGRKDLPQILLENRFLELFSRLMKDRPAFMNQAAPDDPDEEVVLAYGENGEIYERFELTLPINSVVKKISDGSIVLSNSRFDLTINAKCSGFNTNTSTLFEPLYLGRNKIETKTFSASISVSVKYKLRSLFSGKSWQYYRWIDQFMDGIEKDFSFDAFLERIGWDRAVTLSTLRRPPPSKKGDSAISGVMITKKTVDSAESAESALANPARRRRNPGLATKS